MVATVFHETWWFNMALTMKYGGFKYKTWWFNSQPFKVVVPGFTMNNG